MSEYEEYDDVVVTVSIELRRRDYGQPAAGKRTIVRYERTSTHALSSAGQRVQRTDINRAVNRATGAFLLNGIPETIEA